MTFKRLWPAPVASYQPCGSHCHSPVDQPSNITITISPTITITSRFYSSLELRLLIRGNGAHEVHLASESGFTLEDGCLDHSC